PPPRPATPFPTRRSSDLGAEAEPAPPAARRDQCPDLHAVHEHLEHRVARQAFHGHVEPSFAGRAEDEAGAPAGVRIDGGCTELRDRKSTRLNSSHGSSSY